MADVGFPPFPADCAPGTKFHIVGTCLETGGLALAWEVLAEVGNSATIVASAGGCGGAVKDAIKAGWDADKVIQLAKVLSKG